MSKKDTLKIICAILLLILGAWSKSFLPFFVVLLLIDSFKRISYRVKILRYIAKCVKGRTVWVDWGMAIFFASWLFLFVQNNFVAIYTFHTSSMYGSLEPGDLLLVNKWAMGARKNANNIHGFSRNWAFEEIAYGDVIMFNFPEGDTLLNNRPTESYYYLQRLYSNQTLESRAEKFSGLSYKKVSKRPRFVKRVYGLPGDSIGIEKGLFFVDETLIEYSEMSVGRYKVDADLKKVLQQENVEAYNELTTDDGLVFELYEHDVRRLKAKGIKLEEDCLPKNYPDALVFPFTNYLLWNMHNMGPIYVPKKGDTIELTEENLMFYRRCIETFEENVIELKGDEVFLNGRKTHNYTFKMNYYWVMGDNRPHSFDSRFWGFVPDNHILGKVDRVLLSTAKSNGILKSNRFWKEVN